MPEQFIVCPNCKAEIPLTEAISHQIREQLKSEYEAVARKKDKEIKEREMTLSSKEREIEEAQNNFAEQVKLAVNAEMTKIKEDAKKKAEEEFNVRLKDAESKNEEILENLKKANENELALRKACREFEEREQNIELELTRKIDEERKIIKEEMARGIAEEYRMKEAEKEKVINDLKSQIDILRRKAEQGSQQTQGEVLELEMEDILRANFPLDTVEPVPKGITGADVMQKVYTQTGQFCGTIIWEVKRTKAWNDGWIEKLKSDQREIKAEIAVIMTTTMPKDIGSFGYVEGIWITDFSSCIGLATAMRINLIHLAAARSASEGKSEKMEMLYSYLSGSEFRHRVESIVESFAAMQQDLEKEKRAVLKLWAKREKQIQKMMGGTVGMYGDIQGIVGAALPEIKALDIKALPEGTEDKAEDGSDDE
jgi:hypothetical protein